VNWSICRYNTLGEAELENFMSITVQAVYENGILRLMEPIALPESTTVSVTIVHEPENGADGEFLNAQDGAAWLAEIAALPIESGGEEFSGRDHDRILYGPKGAC
jgi:predicted DNA-binding antitoxin AbrB/MazE fold protein